MNPQCPNKKEPVTCQELTQITSAVPTGLPKGLVGSKCTAIVKIAGKDCNCLFDTGSQVNMHFFDQPVSPLCDLL